MIVWWIRMKMCFFFFFYGNFIIWGIYLRGEEKGKKEGKKVMYVEKWLRNEYFISLSENDWKSID